MYKRYIYWEFSRDTIIPLSSSWPLGVEERRSKNISNPTEFFDGGCVNFKLLKMVHNSSMPSSKRVSVWKHSSSSVGCRAGDYELPPATTILCQFRQLARANHVVCVSQKVLNVSEKQGSLPSWFFLPMWWKHKHCWELKQMKGTLRFTISFKTVGHEYLTLIIIITKTEYIYNRLKTIEYCKENCC